MAPLPPPGYAYAVSTIQNWSCFLLQKICAGTDWSIELQWILHPTQLRSNWSWCSALQYIWEHHVL